MKRILSLLVCMAAVVAGMAQVSIAGLNSETPVAGTKYYIVCDNGYFLTTKGAKVQTSSTAPTKAEWQIFEAEDGTFRLRSGSANYLSANGKGFSMGNAVVDATGCGWHLEADKAFRKGCYTLWTTIYLEAFEFDADHALCITNEDGGINFCSLSDVGDKDTAGYSADFLFLTSVPDEWKGETGGGEEIDEIIDVPSNDIESDFLANWEKNMQDAKVLTLVPMDKTQLHKEYWMPVRHGVSDRAMVQYSEDVVKLFHGNRAKNLWFVLPPNACKLRFFIEDLDEEDPDETVKWQDEYDFTEAVKYLRGLPNNKGLKAGPEGAGYGYVFNTELLQGTGISYYEAGKIVPIPCDFLFENKYKNLLIGYEVTYPGTYSDNFKNGSNANGGLLDGYWYKESYALPTSRSYGAYYQGDDDPSIYGGRYEDYTTSLSILKEEYRWADYMGLFCYVETEGDAGFPHRGIKLEDVKVARCYTGDDSVPISASFSNYGVDPIVTATFDVTIGDHHSTLRYKDGIKFLEVGYIDDDLSAPTTPTREPMKILATKINGRELAEPMGINGTIVAIDETDNVRRMPVIEENTGTWCGWCPRGLVGMEKLRETYGEDVALIGIHTGIDSKSNGTMDELLIRMGASAAPICVVNRRAVCDPYSGTSNSRFGILKDAAAMTSLITEASIAFDEVTYNEATSTLNFTTSTTFAINSETCPYKLTYVLCEDGQKFQQNNYYTNRSQVSDQECEYYKTNAPELYELTQKPTPWRTEVNDIMEYCSEAMGIEGSLQAPIRKGEAQKHTFSFSTIYEDNMGYAGNHVANIRNCRLIALLLDNESQEIVQAAQVNLKDLNADGVLDSEGISHLTTTMSPLAPVYDLSGRQTSAKAGIYLQAGSKHLAR